MRKRTCFQCFEKSKTENNLKQQRPQIYEEDSQPAIRIPVQFNAIVNVAIFAMSSPYRSLSELHPRFSFPYNFEFVRDAPHADDKISIEESQPCTRNLRIYMSHVRCLQIGEGSRDSKK